MHLEKKESHFLLVNDEEFFEQLLNKNSFNQKDLLDHCLFTK